MAADELMIEICPRWVTTVSWRRAGGRRGGGREDKKKKVVAFVVAVVRNAERSGSCRGRTGCCSVQDGKRWHVKRELEAGGRRSGLMVVDYLIVPCSAAAFAEGRRGYGYGFERGYGAGVSQAGVGG